MSVDGGWAGAMLLRRYVDEQVRVTFEEEEARGACVYAYSDAVRKDLGVRMAAGEKILMPMPGLYARAEFWGSLDPAERMLAQMRALARMHGDWYFCGFSAAVAYGLSVSYALLDEVEIACATGSRRYHGGKVRARHVDIEGEVAGYASGVSVTSVPRTVFDCLRRTSFRDGCALVDSALRLGLTNKDELKAYFDQKTTGYRGIRRAYRALELADGRSGSGGESIARAAMWELGFAAPELQVEFRDPVDGGVFYVDFCWRTDDGRVIVGELDGGEKYINPAMTRGRRPEWVRRAERIRESRLTAVSSAVVRFSPETVADDYEFSRLLDAFGVPRDHEPAVEVVPPGARPAAFEPPPVEHVPIEAYGL